MSATRACRQVAYLKPSAISRYKNRTTSILFVDPSCNCINQLELNDSASTGLNPCFPTCRSQLLKSKVSPVHGPSQRDPAMVSIDNNMAQQHISTIPVAQVAKLQIILFSDLGEYTVYNSDKLSLLLLPR